MPGPVTLEHIRNRLRTDLDTWTETRAVTSEDTKGIWHLAQAYVALGGDLELDPAAPTRADFDRLKEHRDDLALKYGQLAAAVETLMAAINDGDLNRDHFNGTLERVGNAIDHLHDTWQAQA